MPKKALAVKREKRAKHIQDRPFSGGAQGKRHIKIRQSKAEEIIDADYFSRLETAKDFTPEQAEELYLHGILPPNRIFLQGLRTFIDKCMRTYPGQTCGFIREKIDTVYAQTYGD